jgi:hypothetical protein
VIFDDGEEGLLDLATADFEFLTQQPDAEQPDRQEQPQPAAAAAGQAASDVGQKLHVWWPGDGRWYTARVTHVLANG